MQNILAIQQQ